MTVDVLVDLDNDTYTLQHYDEDFVYDDITLPISKFVADVVKVTLNGVFVCVEKVPDELNQALADYLHENNRFNFC